MVNLSIDLSSEAVRMRGPFQPSPRVTVNNTNGCRIGNGDMVRLNAYKRSIFLVSLVDSLIASAAPTLVKKPKVAQRCQPGAGYVSEAPALQVRQAIVEKRK